MCSIKSSRYFKISKKNLYIWLDRGKNCKRYFFLQGFFFITIYLIIIDNWILTLFVKISYNLTKKDVQYLVNCDSSKKSVSYFPFSVPYVTIFINNFLHLLLNRCDVKLPPVLIDCSVFTSLGSFFMHLPEHFFVVVIFPGYWY